MCLLTLSAVLCIALVLPSSSLKQASARLLRLQLHVQVLRHLHQLYKTTGPSAAPQEGSDPLYREPLPAEVGSLLLRAFTVFMRLSHGTASENRVWTVSTAIAACDTALRQSRRGTAKAPVIPLPPAPCESTSPAPGTAVLSSSASQLPHSTLPNSADRMLHQPLSGAAGTSPSAWTAPSGTGHPLGHLQFPVVVGNGAALPQGYPGLQGAVAGGVAGMLANAGTLAGLWSINAAGARGGQGAQPVAVPNLLQWQAWQAALASSQAVAGFGPPGVPSAPPHVVLPGMLQAGAGHGSLGAFMGTQSNRMPGYPAAAVPSAGQPGGATGPGSTEGKQ